MPILERFKHWQNKRKWLQYFSDKGFKDSFQFQELQLRDFRQEVRRRKQLRKLAKSIHDRRHDEYVV